MIDKTTRPALDFIKYYSDYCIYKILTISFTLTQTNTKTDTYV